MMRMITGALLSLALICPATLAAQSRGEKPAPAVVTTPVNLNTATVTQLATLPGIGTRTAERIVEYRQKNGGFKKVEDLMNVRGVGEKSFLKIKPMISVMPQKTDRATP